MINSFFFLIYESLGFCLHQLDLIAQGDLEARGPEIDEIKQGHFLQTNSNFAPENRSHYHPENESTSI